MENWKPARDKNGEILRSPFGWSWLVSDKGRVQTVSKHGKARLLKISIKKDGYSRVSIMDSHPYVHRLVCFAFRGAIPKGYEVDHINRKRSDNRLENLRYVTPNENGLNTKEYKRSFCTNNPNPKKLVICLETGVIYESTTDAGRKCGCSQAGISKACRNHRPIKGFRYEFFNPEGKQ